MGKFIKIEKGKHRWRVTIPKEFHQIIGDNTFIYMEEVYKFLVLIPLDIPTFSQLIEKIEKIKKMGI